jgi:hypothetical protein
MDSIGQGVLPEIDGNQIYDGCHIENQEHRKSKGTFPYPPPTCTVEMDSIGQGILPEMDGNQIYDGCRGSHIENRRAPKIERNLPLPTPNMHSQNGFDRPRRSPLVVIFEVRPG